MTTYNTPQETGGDRSDEQTLHILLSRLSDPDKGVRAEAMHGLVAIGEPAISPCIALLRDDDWRVRYRAAEALGLIGDGEVYAPLIAALGDERDHVRYMAAKGLGLLGDPRAVEHLRSVQQDENEFVRRSVATSLGKLGGADALRALRSALEGEANEGVREVIIAALRDAGEEEI
ncbi:MAG: HEAT repeat domain-containing protein [Methanomicrobiales archaeon]|nr:HEAT repeat domain-containing protein [Methanomicrobiales archaeon]